MKSLFLQYHVGVELVHAIHFSRELPVVPLPRSRYARQPKIKLDRQTPVAWIAGRITEESQGRFAVELVEPYAGFRSWLRELLFLPGVVTIVEADRYAMQFNLARCLDASEILRAATEITRDHFYAGEDLIFLNNGQVVVGSEGQQANSQEKEAPK